MIVLETSAVIAMVLNEASRPALEAKVAQEKDMVIGAPSVFEAAMVLSSRRGRDSEPELRRFLSILGVRVVDFTDLHAQTAHEAFLRYGKGRNPAGLNLGDCMSHAVAKIADAPLLFVGNDFTRTDISAA